LRKVKPEFKGARLIKAGTKDEAVKKFIGKRFKIRRK